MKKIRLYLWSALVIVLVGLGINLYNNLSHSMFSVEVKGTHAIYSFPSNLPNGTPVHPITASSTSITFGSLKTSWWGNGNQPVYRLDNVASGLWFKVRPTLRGNFSLVLGPSAMVGVMEIRTLNGTRVNSLLPGQWYQVEQYENGEWHEMKFEWK